MNLDPTVSPWLGIFASMGVCLWMAAIGLPLSHAVFGDRPRPVWPFYAPVIGVVVVLLATNLSAYLIPGAPSAWFGLLAPSAFSILLMWRSGTCSRLARPEILCLALTASFSIGIFWLAQLNRTQVWYVDGSWHFALILRMARGVFPPVTPYGPDAGIGYHYGADLLAASLVNAAAAPPWTALYAVQAFLVVALIMAAVGYAHDFGVPLPFAFGIGVVLAFFPGELYAGFTGQLEWPASNSDPIIWLVAPPQALALALVLLVAAVLEAFPTKRRAAVLAAAAGAFALAEAAILIFSGAALALVSAVRLVGLRRRQRLLLCAALLVAAALAALAGGPISDALFGRGGTAGMARVEFEPRLDDVLPVKFVQATLIRLGVIPLVAIGALSAIRSRSWGLAFLTVAATMGLVAAEFIHSPLARNDGRFIWLTTAVAMLVSLVAVGGRMGELHGLRKYLAAAVVALFVLVPTGLPRAIAAVQLALRGPSVQCLGNQEPQFCLLGRMRFGQELERNWDFYAWLADYLPNSARLLTPFPAPAASLAGVASPTSGSQPQALAAYLTPVYEDALKYLHRDDLADLGITHLHMTDAWAAALAPEARALLESTEQFKLVAEHWSVSNQRHRIYEVLPGAGTRDLAPSSFRRLKAIISWQSPVLLPASLSQHQRGTLLFLFTDHPDVRASSSGFIDRATRIPRYKPLSDVPDSGILFLPDAMEPSVLGLSRGDAVWQGFAMLAYDLSAVGSRIWRVDSQFSSIPSYVRPVCDVAGGEVELRVLGEPGTEVVVGQSLVQLIGVPQLEQIDLGACNAPVVAMHSHTPAFAQILPRREGPAVESSPDVAGLGHDGGIQDGKAVVNLWYRNPNGIPFASGTEFRLYKAGPTGVAPDASNPRSSVRWWNGPIALAHKAQMVRVEFDAARLEINEDPGAGGEVVLARGQPYLLALNVTSVDPKSGYAEIQQQVPLVRFVLDEQAMTYEVLAGIVTVARRDPGPVHQNRTGGIAIGWIHDLTP